MAFCGGLIGPGCYCEIETRSGLAGSIRFPRQRFPARVLSVSVFLVWTKGRKGVPGLLRLARVSLDALRVREQQVFQEKGG